jgi:ferritin-like metal-binding protein YciE
MLNTITDLFPVLLQELYSAEVQLTQALPRMAAKASSGALRAAFEEHLRETQQHVARIEFALGVMGVPAAGRVCEPIAAMIDAGEDIIQASGDPDVIDAALAGAARQVEHFEIASYITAAEMAYLLGRAEVSTLLHETLDEEKATDSRLHEIVTLEINPRAFVWHASS